MSGHAYLLLEMRASANHEIIKNKTVKYIEYKTLTPLQNRDITAPLIWFTRVQYCMPGLGDAFSGSIHNSGGVDGEEFLK
jgi:hypothetical protein